MRAKFRHSREGGNPAYAQQSLKALDSRLRGNDALIVRTLKYFILVQNPVRTPSILIGPQLPVATILPPTEVDSCDQEAPLYCQIPVEPKHP